MKDGVVAKRYAAALLEAARETSGVENVEKELAAVLDVWNAEPEMVDFLDHPTVSREAKKRLVARVFGERVSRPVLNFLYVLLDHRRQDTLPQIIAQYRRKVDEVLGRIHAEIETALPVSDEEAREWKSRLARKTGKDVSLRLDVNPALIGGARLRVGDRVWDATISGRLERFRGQLKQIQAR
ncbi:MAG: F0F1 ATP synthase subunit delta [Kyrpidia sp.]|nr:F0F1 ATP synthase subunit delta [Kyrpidia sp.]